MASDKRHLFVVGFFSVSFLVVALFSTFMIWPRIIAKRVQSFCDTIVVGETSQVVPIKAQNFKLKMRLFPPFSIDKNKKEIVMQYSDGVGFDHYYCTVEQLDGTVTSKRFSN